MPAFIGTEYAGNPSFDAVSIRPNVAEGGVSAMRITPGRASMQNVSLCKVILNAHGIPDDREYMIVGPAWLSTQRFDIEATFSAEVAPTEVRQMLQWMPADRFRLALHKETRQIADVFDGYCEGWCENAAVGSRRVCAPPDGRGTSRPRKVVAGIGPEGGRGGRGCGTFDLYCASGTAGIEVLVIDHIEKMPTEN